MFWKESPKTQWSISPVSMRFDWKTNKKLIDQIKLTESNISDKSTTPEEKAIFQKKLDWLKQEKPYSFTWWNKELEQEMMVYPTEFIVLDEVSCVKWRDDTHNCSIYSNEIKYFDKEKITAVSAKWWQVYSDFYSPVTKDEFKKRWLKFTKWLIVQEWDMMNEYYINWTVINQWIEDTKEIDKNNYKIKFNWVDERTQWSVTYYVPRWTQWTAITDEEKEVAMVSVDLLEDYYREKNWTQVDLPDDVSDE